MQYQIQTSPWLSLAHILGHISVLIFFILVWFSLKRKDEIYNLKISQEQLKNTIAKQVSHDIRSPLSALTMVAGALKDIPEDKRILIRNATQRINDIANDLLQKGQISNLQTQQPSQFGSEKNISSSPSSHSVTKEFIPALIDILVSEKRTQYREHTGLEINVDFKNSFGAFAEVNSPQLKRVVSNLINNSVEAFDNNEGKVIIGVKKVESDAKVEIFVKDNGKGIPKHILNKLGQVGISHGKEGTLAGNGLGIYHAKKTIESFGGTFEIESNEGTGTFIRIQLPLAEAPKWFANKVNLTDKKYLVSLDDDISIHQIWSGRLQSLGIDDIEHIKFQSGEAFEQYVNSNIVRLKYTLFLVDFELLNQNKTGLDIIEDLGIEKYSILVTSRYEEADIQARAARLRLPLLPKSLAGFVPIHIEAPKEKYDLILIDDDTQLIHPVWGSVAKSKNLSIRMFSSPQEFRAVVDTIDRQTPVYVDVSLGENINGIDFSREVSNFGFTEIYLATGYAPDSVNAPTFVRAVVGKDFPA
ncbi:MAG: sensor histidine kinase [Pseudobdellovibrionaceae bacterium]